MGLNCLTESAADDARRFWDRMAGNCRSSEGALWQEVRDVALRTDGWRETRAAYSLAEVCGLDCARTRYPNSPWHKQVSARQQGELEGFTYDPRSNPLVRHREEVPRRLDHIYIAAGDTSQLSLRVGRDFVGEPLSDHYGVWASLRIARRV